MKQFNINEKYLMNKKANNQIDKKAYLKWLGLKQKL